jgi:signal transduction histidine kinase
VLLVDPTQEQLARELQAIAEEIDLDYIERHAPGAFEAAADGISRIATIVRAMKEFSHPDDRVKRPTDLNRAIETTLTIACNEYKYLAEVKTELGELPPVFCHVGDIKQVILNLLINAAHAIGDVVGSVGGKGTILIRSVHVGRMARIDIVDTGAGIAEVFRERVFDPFFTTKEVGKGTGQGLAIARSIIVDKHGGELSFESEVGKGTTFTILLPIDPTTSTVNESAVTSRRIQLSKSNAAT